MSVEASITSLEGLEKKLAVTVSAEKFTDEYNKKFKSISSNLRLPGFRKGKIPLGLIQSRYGQSIISEVTQELISSSLQSALKDNNCSPVAMPKVDIKQIEKGKPFTYEATFEEFPEIETIDMGRRALHNEGSTLLQEKLSDVITMDFDTARRLFTLICVLQMRG